MTRHRIHLLALAAAFVLAGCATGPAHEVPTAPVPATFKEAPPGWVEAQPQDTVERGAWWAPFADPVLDDLMRRVEVNNQNVAAATAAYAQARALVREQRAALFPTVGVDGGVSRDGGGGATPSSRRVTVGIGASWEPDVFGRLRGSATAAGARAQASEADLAAAVLAARGELALNYLALRGTDAEAELLATTLEGYRRDLQITRNRYEAGVAPRSDLLQAQTQLANAEADQAGLERQRATLEHAIAVLVGSAPADLAIARAPWRFDAPVPSVPGVLPSTLLQRRPDIAAAERSVAAANAQVGVARAAFFPSLLLSGDAGNAAASIGSLFNASAFAWSLGLQLAQTVFDAGARSARVDEARAAWEGSVAQYRQTVLTALQQVEDQLVAVRVLERQLALRRQASEAADLTEQQVRNRYAAGQVSYSEVVQAQVAALNARRSLVQAGVDRQSAAVSLVQALGGGWSAMPTTAAVP